MYIYVYCAHLASLGSEHSVFRVNFKQLYIYIYIYIIYIYIYIIYIYIYIYYIYICHIFRC